MKRTILFLMAAALPLMSADPKTVDAVKAAERAWASATVKGDAAALKNLLADDISYTHSNGETDTKEVFIGNLTGARKYHTIEFESLDARLYLNSGAAVVMALGRVETSQKGGQVNAARLRFVHFWIYQNGRWQLAAHQSLRLTN